MKEQEITEYFKIFKTQEETESFIEEHANMFSESEWRFISFLLVPQCSCNFFLKFRSECDFEWLTSGIVLFGKQEVFWSEENVLNLFTDINKKCYSGYTISPSYFPELLNDLKSLKQKYTNKKIVSNHSSFVMKNI